MSDYQEATNNYFYKYRGKYYLKQIYENNKLIEILPTSQFIEEINSKSEANIEDYEYIDIDHVAVRKDLIPPDTSLQLPYGIYNIAAESDYIYLNPTIFNFDNYINLQSEIIIQIEENIEDFIRLKAEYTRLKLLHKRGYLLYGPPGNGKSMLIGHLVKKYKEKAYIIYIDSRNTMDCIDRLREKLAGHLVFFIFEEITFHTDYIGVNSLLNFLDGPYSWDDSIFIATTNYPERLPGNIIDRPSRFDLV